jgi:hypothetical protein
MKLVFCIPGNTFSKAFLISWTQTLQWCHDNDISYDVSITYIPIIYHARNMLMGGTRYTPRTFKPFNGAIDYDWIIWIDSDQIWNPSDIEQIISNPEHKVVTGMVLMYDNEHFNVSTYDDTSYDKRRWLTREDVDIGGERFTTPECGMGFMAVQKGVFEQLEYPWFFPMPHDEEEVLWFEAEDGSFCNRITELGIEIWVDPKLQIGHEKHRILTAELPLGLTKPA